VVVGVRICWVVVDSVREMLFGRRLGDGMFVCLGVGLCIICGRVWGVGGVFVMFLLWGCGGGRVSAGLGVGRCFSPVWRVL
jgi:hypothetical protein